MKLLRYHLILQIWFGLLQKTAPVHATGAVIYAKPINLTNESNYTSEWNLCQSERFALGQQLRTGIFGLGVVFLGVSMYTDTRLDHLPQAISGERQ
jgi:hypothetical protein